MSKFIVTKSSNGEYRFKLNAGNGETILTSEGYSAKPGCMNGIDSVKSNAPHEERYDKKTSTNDKFYFNLKATNGQVIGTSQMYAGSSGRDNGIESVRTNAPVASIDDQTI
jgi:uncharacterized protein YegP (UPF0339 family)